MFNFEPTDIIAISFVIAPPIIGAVLGFAWSRFAPVPRVKTRVDPILAGYTPAMISKFEFDRKEPTFDKV
jgi:hypothetical protein